MTRALLDLLMPANSIDECAREIERYVRSVSPQEGAETVLFVSNVRRTTEDKLYDLID